MKITTPRLIVRSLAEKDRMAMQRILTDFENSDVYMYDYKAPTDTEIIRTLIPFWVKSHKYYTICISDTDEIAGFLSMDCNELGFTMREAYKRKGYGYEAASALLEYIKIKKKIYHFTAQAALENIPSVKLLKKLGFEIRSTEYVQFRENMPPVECGNFIMDFTTGI